MAAGSPTALAANNAVQSHAVSNSRPGEEFLRGEQPSPRLPLQPALPAWTPTCPGATEGGSRHSPDPWGEGLSILGVLILQNLQENREILKERQVCGNGYCERQAPRLLEGRRGGGESSLPKRLVDQPPGGWLGGCGSPEDPICGV